MDNLTKLMSKMHIDTDIDDLTNFMQKLEIDCGEDVDNIIDSISTMSIKDDVVDITFTNGVQIYFKLTKCSLDDKRLRPHSPYWIS